MRHFWIIGSIERDRMKYQTVIHPIFRNLFDSFLGTKIMGTTLQLHYIGPEIYLRLFISFVTLANTARKAQQVIFAMRIRK